MDQGIQRHLFLRVNIFNVRLLFELHHKDRYQVRYDKPFCGLARDEDKTWVKYFYIPFIGMQVRQLREELLSDRCELCLGKGAKLAGILVKSLCVFLMQVDARHVAAGRCIFGDC